MASRRSTTIQAALQGKGFRVAHTHHQYLILYVDGLKTGIRTRVSHGRRDYGNSLLSRMKDQLHLRNVRELLDLIDCPLDGETYVRRLRQKGVLPD